MTKLRRRMALWLAVPKLRKKRMRKWLVISAPYSAQGRFSGCMDQTRGQSHANHCPAPGK